MGGVVDTQAIAQPAAAPPKRPRPAASRGLKPMQAFTAFGCVAVLLLSAAAALNGILGRAPIPHAFKDGIVVTHFALVFAALPLSAVQLLLPKGTGLHRIIGYTWCATLLAASLVSFGVHEINGAWSPPHYFAVLSLIMVPLIVFLARSHRTVTHSRVVLGYILFFLVAAGLFTFIPGRAPGDLLAAYWA